MTKLDKIIKWARNSSCEGLVFKKHGIIHKKDRLYFKIIVGAGEHHVFFDIDDVKNFRKKELLREMAYLELKAIDFGYGIKVNLYHKLYPFSADYASWMAF